MLLALAMLLALGMLLALAMLLALGMLLALPHAEKLTPFVLACEAQSTRVCGIGHSRGTRVRSQGYSQAREALALAC